MEAAIGAVMAARPEGGGRFRLTFPDGWQQGRGTFGGVVLGALVGAAAHHVGAADRGLRSLTAELCGPTQPGPATIQVEALRAGSAVTTVAARLVQGDEIQAHAVAVFGRRRGDGAWPSPPPIAAPPRDEVAPLVMDGPFFPRFARHFVFRNTGPLPFCGAAEAIAHGYIAPRVPSPPDAAWLVACADAWWPSLFSTAPKPVAIATIAFTLDVVGALDGLTPSTSLLHVGRTLGGHDGYAVEARELWAPDGRLLALNQQTFAVLR